MSERVNRSISLASRVEMSGLSGPQQLEAKMLDLLSPVLVSLPQFSGVEGLRRMNTLLDRVDSLQTFEQAFRQQYGRDSLGQLRRSAISFFGDVRGLDPNSRDSSVRMNLVFWAKRQEPEEGTAQTMGVVPRSLNSKAVGKRQSETTLHWRQTTGSGLPKGPGSYKDNLPRKLKRRNGQGLAGNKKS